MSSILKALKKLEDEKIARNPEELQINADILRGDRSPRISSASMIVLSLLLMACASYATYYLMVRGKSEPSPSVAVINGLTKQAGGQDIEHPAATSFGERSEIVRNIDSKLPSHINGAEQGKKLNVQHDNKTTRNLNDNVAEHQTTSVRPKSVQPVTETFAVPRLVVNGIAVQTESAESMAIINEIPVSLGGNINGVVVREIYKDRVLFQYNGQTFEVLLGQSNK